MKAFTSGVSSVVLLLAVSSTHAAMKQPNCSSAGLSRNCEVFRPWQDQQFIPLKGGERIPNPLYNQAFTPDGNGKTPDLRALTQKRLEQESKLLKAWAKLPKKQRPGEDFQVGFARLLQTSALDPWINGKPSAKDAKILLPWPPQDKQARTIGLSYDAVTRFLNRLPPEAVSEIKRLANEVRGLSRGPTATNTAKVREYRPAYYMEKLAYVKNAILDEITRGRPLNELSPAEQIQYEKVRTVELAPVGIGDEKPDCQMFYPNAGYVPASHSVEICPSMKNASEAGVVALLAHEVGHAIDPCAMHFTLMRFNTEKVRRTAQDGSAPKKNAEEIKDLAMRGTRYSNAALTLFPAQAKEIEEGQKAGFYDIASAGVGFDANPQKKTYECLQKSGNFRLLSDKEIPELADRSAAKIAPIRKLTPEATAQLAEMNRTRLKTIPDCNVAAGNPSQMREVMADAWGAKVLGRWLTDHPVESDIEKAGMFITFMIGACNGQEFARQRPNQPPSDHPADRARVDTIYLSDPRIQKALGCRPDPAKTCLAKFGTQGKLTEAEPAKPAVDGKVTR